jgi:hypothetical protein
MHEISAIALFCFDAREEKAGTETLVGILPDNVNIPGFPGGFIQMTVYFRVHLSVTYRPTEIIARVTLPDGSEINRYQFDQTELDKTREKAVKSGNTYIGLIARFAVAPLRIDGPGRIQALLNVDGTDIVAGSLNCQLQTPPT